MTRTTPKVECVDCAAMIYKPAELSIGEAALYPPPYRPNNPRKIDPRSGPRKPRCATHQSALINAQRARAAERHQKRHHGMPAHVRASLRAIQGDCCPCGNKIKHTDHDHAIARRECDHPVAQSCRRCWRGLLCHTCNSDILGRGYTIERLLALVEYLRNPPAWQLDPEDY